MFPEADGGSADAEPAITELVGRYELLRRLGSGGMAEVHLARAQGMEGFEKLVVLKRILPHLAADRHFVKMFLAEARLAAILDHPNVVQVFDLGVDESDFYFTMEFVYGENLQSMLRAARRRGGGFPLEHAITIAIGVASGLHCAHERVGFDGSPLGIVHRDVSPTNVMASYDGCVKVADFGIAKVLTRTDVTRAGTRKGKVPYMSPEQCKAGQIDRRSDIFSLGIVLYEATTMSRLFEGDNEFGVMNRIVNGDFEPPSARRTGYPKDLERIVMRALTVDRDQRYATARELQLDLERFVREHKLRSTDSALAEWMHDMFRPRPFPWGALMGHGVSGTPATGIITRAEPGSSGSISSSSHRQRPDLTPHSDPSYVSRGSAAGSVKSTVEQARKDGTLRGLAIGLGAVAVAATLGVGGLILATRHANSEPGDGAEVAPADAAGAAGAAAEADKNDEIEPIGSERDAEKPVPEAAVGAADDGADTKDAAPDEEQDKAPEDGGAADEDLVVVDEDGRPGRPTSVRKGGKGKGSGRGKAKGKGKDKASDKDKGSKGKGKGKGKGEKKSNLDSFMPGAGG